MRRLMERRLPAQAASSRIASSASSLSLSISVVADPVLPSSQKNGILSLGLSQAGGHGDGAPRGGAPAASSASTSLFLLSTSSLCAVRPPVVGETLASSAPGRERLAPYQPPVAASCVEVLADDSSGGSVDDERRQRWDERIGPAMASLCTTGIQVRRQEQAQRLKYMLMQLHR